MKLKIGKRSGKLLTIAVVLIVAAAAMTVVLGGKRAILLPVPGAGILSETPRTNVTFNVTIDSLSYLNQPTQFYWTGMNDSFPSETTHNGTDWLLNTSAYQVFYNNASSAAQSTPSYARFSMGSSLGSNISFLYSASRVALNGSETFYLTLGTSQLSSFPTASGNNTIYIKATWNAGGSNYTLSYGYFSSSGLVTGSFSKDIQPLQFYQFLIYESNKSTVLTVQQLGQTIDTATLGTANLSSVISTKASATNLYSQFMSEANAATSNTAMILNYGYLVDHDTYNNSQNVSRNYLQVNGPADALASGTVSQAEPFDPGTANATFLGPRNSTLTDGNTVTKPTLNLSSDFTNITYSSSNASINSAGLNKSLAVSNLTQNETMNASQAYVTQAITNETPSSVSATLQVYTWNSTDVNKAIMNFMKGYASNLMARSGYNVPLDHVTIANYLITKIGFNEQLGNATAAAMRTVLLNGYAAALAANNLTLVNTTTNAIVAGAFAGDFFFQGTAYHPEVQGTSIMDPVNGQTFSSLQDAGFAAGSYISSSGAVIVPSLELQGFSGASPIYSVYGFSLGSLNPLSWGQSTLTAAGSAVGNFFSSAGSAATNTLSKLPADIGAQNLIKPLKSTAANAISSLKQDTSKIESGVMPILGGTVSKIKTGFTGAVDKASGAIGSAASSAAAGIMSGAKSVKNDVFSVDKWEANTALKAFNASKGVASSLFAKLKNAGGSIYSKAKSTLGMGISALDNVGNTIAQKASGAISYVKNGFTGIGSDISNAAGALKNAAGGAFHFLAGIGATIGHILEYVGIGVVIVAVILAVFFIMRSKREAEEGVAKEFVGNEGPEL